MRKRFLVVLLGLMALSVPMFGGVLIDFAGTDGGQITVVGNNVTGVNINIGTMLVVGDATPGLDGKYTIDNGLLNFNFTSVGGVPTPGGTLTITGTIRDCVPTIFTPGSCIPNNSLNGISGTLLWGIPVDTFSYNFTAGGAIEVHGSGPDEKHDLLMQALGLVGVPWAFSGFSIGGHATTTPGVWDATSTDIGNNTVPEPASVLLLGTLLFGVSHMIRRRTSKA